MSIETVRKLFTLVFFSNNLPEYPYIIEQNCSTDLNNVTLATLAIKEYLIAYSLRLY